MEFSMNLKDYITESFKKEYAYRVKLAHDCGADQMDMLEKCLVAIDLASSREHASTIHILFSSTIFPSHTEFIQ